MAIRKHSRLLPRLLLHKSHPSSPHGSSLCRREHGIQRNPHLHLVSPRRLHAHSNHLVRRLHPHPDALGSQCREPLLPQPEKSVFLQPISVHLDRHHYSHGPYTVDLGFKDAGAEKDEDCVAVECRRCCHCVDDISHNQSGSISRLG